MEVLFQEKRGSYGRKNGSNYVKKCWILAPSEQYIIYSLIEKRGSLREK